MTYRSVFLSYLILALVAGRVDNAISQSLPEVVIETELGSIHVVVDTIRAPITGTNFLRYVDEYLYDGGNFSRTVTPRNQPNDSIRIEVIQALMDRDRREESHPAIALERTTTTGIRHRDGTISMARAGPNTATSSFFICIGDQPSLDYGGHRNPDGQGFAAFGSVISGMDVVRRIHSSPADGQSLTPPIGVLRVRRIGTESSGGRVGVSANTTRGG